MRQLPILLLKYVAGLVLGGATLWWVVDRAGPVDGSVLVHVIEADVEVTIGGLSFPIDERRFAPIECRFRPGRYLLQNEPEASASSTKNGSSSVAAVRSS